MKIENIEKILDIVNDKTNGKISEKEMVQSITAEWVNEAKKQGRKFITFSKYYFSNFEKVAEWVSEFAGTQNVFSEGSKIIITL